MAWADSRLGEFGGVNQKIGFSRLSAIPSPEVFLSPAAGPGGQEVTLQGFGFQPKMDIFVLLGDSTIALARTNDEGRFSSRLFMPVTGEGAQTLRAVDASGNVASTSFFTEFGFGSIEDLMLRLEQQVDEIKDQPSTDEDLDGPLSQSGTGISGPPSAGLDIPAAASGFPGSGFTSIGRLIPWALAFLVILLVLAAWSSLSVWSLRRTLLTKKQTQERD